jgi:hypothetical protein
VTHTDAISALLALQTATPPTADAQARAHEHVAACSDCWATLVALTGEDVGAEKMQALFGCDAVRDALVDLVDVEPRMFAREHPDAARHLGWCHACRTRLAELIAVEREFALRPQWIDVVTAAGERVREVVGQVIVRLGNAGRGILAAPDGFVLGPPVALAGVRGEAPVDASSTPSLSQSTCFPLGDSGVTAEIGVESADDARAGLSLRLTTTSDRPVSVQLREVRPDDEVLIARHTLHGDEPVYIRGLWPASFIVVLHEPEDPRRYRVRLDIGPAI